jgi:hypothetical protein
MVDVVEKSSVVDDEERRTGRATTGKVSVAMAVVILMAILIPPALIRPGAQGQLPFEDKLLADLDSAGPDYVFIGNSMLTSRIDTDVLAGKLGDRCCYLLATGGVESAWMHQALKNLALAAKHRPKKIFVFFRDAFLTQPSYRATDRYWWRIERLSHADEPELTRAMSLSRTWQEKLEFTLGDIYPIQKYRDRASQTISWVASEAVTPGRVRFGGAAGSRYDSLFDLDKLRSTDQDDTAFEEEGDADYDFNARIGNSLLPSMIHLAHEAGVPLVFVRVQRRPSRTGPPAQSRALQDYMIKLQAYFSQQGVQFYDFNGDPELTLDRYLDGDHIRPSWKPQSTELFMKRLEKLFP